MQLEVKIGSKVKSGANGEKEFIDERKIRPMERFAG